jgi:hypothetical protein
MKNWPDYQIWTRSVLDLYNLILWVRRQHVYQVRHTLHLSLMGWGIHACQLKRSRELNSNTKQWLHRQRQISVFKIQIKIFIDIFKQSILPHISHQAESHWRYTVEILSCQLRPPPVCTQTFNKQWSEDVNMIQPLPQRLNTTEWHWLTYLSVEDDVIFLFMAYWHHANWLDSWITSF